MTLSHFDSDGHSHMVDVGAKQPSQRMAIASGLVRMKAETMALIRDQRMAKGDVLEVARLAGIMAAKRTDEWIPLCHSLGLESVAIDFSVVSDTELRIESKVKTFSKTGVEMEALVAVSAAALTLYDMCKSVDREMQIEHVQLEEKMGGKSGHFLRQP
jgi:cyclic pyranopterin phosphate synthase